MTKEEIESNIEKCKPIIKNWEALEGGLDFDFQVVDINGLLIDQLPNECDEKWVISLITTLYHPTNDGWDVYSVRWQFKDLWGNLAFFSLQGYTFTGELHLNYIDYDDFAIVSFSIVKPDGTPIFKFDQPDEVSIVSVEKKGHLTMKERYPEDYLQDNDND